MMAVGEHINIFYSEGKSHQIVRVTSHQRPSVTEGEVLEWTSRGGICIYASITSILYCHLVIIEYVNIILCLMQIILLCQTKYLQIISKNHI